MAGLTDPEKRQDLENRLQHSTSDPILMRLKYILTKKLEGIERYSETYENPSWPHKQADMNGQVRVLKIILQLLDHVKDTK